MGYFEAGCVAEVLRTTMLALCGLSILLSIFRIFASANHAVFFVTIFTIAFESFGARAAYKRDHTHLTIVSI